jgi:hypothetical protein
MWARRAGKDDAWTNQRMGHTATSNMIDRDTRRAVTLADLKTTSRRDGRHPRVGRSGQVGHAVGQSGAKPTAENPPTSAQPTGIIECEGGDLNPYASYGASTSS